MSKRKNELSMAFDKSSYKYVKYENQDFNADIGVNKKELWEQVQQITLNKVKSESTEQEKT